MFAYSVDRCASVFLHPVTEDIAPGYHSIVHKYRTFLLGASIKDVHRGERVGFSNADSFGTGVGWI